MSNAVLYMSMSLDGFVAGPNVGMGAAPRSGGHCLAGRSWTEGIVLLTYQLALRGRPS
jgi:hypothetical protein